MPQYNKADLGRAAAQYGYVRDTFEKVLRLKEILEHFNTQEYLAEHLMLKGGTAINLTVFNLLRLSVDIDMDYTPNDSKDDMLESRAQITDLIKEYMKKEGYFLSSASRFSHSLDAFHYNYINAGGNKDMIKLEINYSLRAHIFESTYRSILNNTFKSDIRIRTVAPLEIFAAKGNALISRAAARDLYDWSNLIEHNLFTDQKDLFRKCFAFYITISAGKGQINRDFNPSAIDLLDFTKIRRDLFPVISRKDNFQLEERKRQAKQYIADLMQLEEKEIEYMTCSYKNELFIEKYQYVNNEGIKRTAIIKSKDLYTNSFFKKMNILTKVAFGVFGAAYIICLIIFVIVLRRKFYEPLEKLNKAMELLAEGKRKKPIDYSGPREFVDICDRFNVMVSKLEDSENQRKKLMNDKERMMADISHDLKTPITSIQGYAKALSDGIIPDGDKDKYIKIIYEKSKKLTDLINIFHEYSKLEHPDFNLTLEKVDLSEYLRAYIALKYEDIVESGFNIEVDIPEEEMEMKIDKIQLQRVFDNILGNSIKHNEKGTNIYVSLEKKSASYEIIIADDGKGIPKEIASNIFEAFTVGDESRNSRQGSGLGLAIAKTIVELHEGTIELVLAPPKELSTEFKITLKKGPKL